MNSFFRILASVVHIITFPNEEILIFAVILGQEQLEVVRLIMQVSQHCQAIATGKTLSISQEILHGGTPSTSIADINNEESDITSAANMTKYFIRLENDHIVPRGTPGHGFDGFLDISGNNRSFLGNQSMATAILQAAAVAFGQDPGEVLDLVLRDWNVDSPERDQMTGIFGIPTHKNTTGRRVDARTIVLNTLNKINEQGEKKYPLLLKTQALATKVLFESTGSNITLPRAIGVQYLVGQSMYRADPRFNSSNKGNVEQSFARKEVVLSGGVFNNPQLLKLSGIGPRSELESFNITVLVDLPGVGLNLQDNTEIGYNIRAQQNFTTLAPDCTFGTPGDPCLEAWMNRGQGPYAQGLLDSIMFKSSHAAYDERDIFMFNFPGATRGFWPASATVQLPPDPPTTFAFSLVKIHVQGRLGTVKLRSADPQDTPDINFRFYENSKGEMDLNAMAEAIEFARQIIDSIGEPIGPCNESTPCDGTRSCDVKDFIRKQTWSHHATSSCAIGADDDLMAVLDSRFRVRGTKGLRVVDGSVFPRTPGAFPVLPTFMISLKAADVILSNSELELRDPGD
jgi:choline dehydrogenase